MRCSEWCPLCYSGVKGRRTYPGHLGYRRKCKQIFGSQIVGISRRDASKVLNGERMSIEPCSVMTRYESLWEFISATEFEDGSKRQTPSLTIFQDQGLLKACLNDKEQGLVAFCSGTSLTALLEALDEGLAQDSLDWRKASPPRKK